MTITKFAITLNSPADWEPWIELAKSHATAQRIWEYVNPENPQRIYLSEPTIPTTDTVRQLLRSERTSTLAPSTPSSESSEAEDPPAPPPAPGPSKVTRRRGRPQAVDDDDDDNDTPPAPGPAPAPPAPQGPTDAEVEARLKIETMRYKHEYQAYLHQQQAFDVLPTIIQNSVNRGYLLHTYNCDSAYEMLVSLKERVAPDDFATAIDLRNQYKSLMKPPKG